jgi:uncharacterized membrane protein YccC
MSMFALAILLPGFDSWANGGEAHLAPLLVVFIIGTALAARGAWLFWTVLRTKPERENMNE